jgi:hypothetical protein
MFVNDVIRDGLKENQNLIEIEILKETGPLQIL